MSFFSRILSRGGTSNTKELGKTVVRGDSPAAGLKTLTGRFGVGFVDVEWEDMDELVLGEQDIKLLGHEIPFVLARIYYPSVTNPETDHEQEETQKGTWLPSSHYFPGYGYFLRWPALVSSGIGRLLASNVRIHAKESVPLVGLKEFGQEKLPILIFSHGLAGIRTTYSTICCEMASRGIIVVALEHRDGSASMTIDQKGKVYPYRAGPSGLSLPMVDYEYRAAQLRHRIREFKSTVKFVESLNRSGDFVSLLFPKILHQFRGRLLCERLIIMGHSFGAATCLAAAQQIQNVSCCIVFDPWMFPMPPSGLEISRTNIDTLVIQNEKFSWSENDAAIQKFVEAFRQTEKAFAKVRMIGCGHMDQSDLASIIPGKIIKIFRPGASIPINHHRILQVNVDLVSAHLKHSFPMYSFDSKYEMIELGSTDNRKISPMLTSADFEDENEKESKIDPLIKLETFLNYK